MSSVNGKVGLITGGANGIGAEVARRLHAKRAKLVLTDLDEAQLKDVATRLGEDRVLTTTSVEKCGEAFVKGIEGRKRRIYCPGWVGLMRWMRPLIATPVLERDIRKLTPDLLPRMDADAAALGRHFSRRTEAREKH
jgi:NAD(P)-dependent dehydrogenase (short-subunit alcohol dehydrogenase family)